MALTSALTEAAFAEHRQRDWSEIDALAHRVSARGLGALSSADAARVPRLYRDLCADLARAEGARYSASLVEYLQELTARSHTMFYSAQARARRTGFRVRVAGARDAVIAFPQAVRRHRGAMLLALALFGIPFVAGIVGAFRDPLFAFRVAPEDMLRQLSEGYARGFADGRGGGEGTMMAGFYVNNNVGIALRCFALGIFGGLGSAFYLVQNGLAMGAILGYVMASQEGAAANIVTFVVGHGTLELGAIVIAGGAGLAMGWSVVAPGERTRLASLQAVARDIVVIVFGAAIMLLMAAAIEGFWSGSSVPSDVKRVVGATLFVAVLGYLVLAGRAGGDGSLDGRVEARAEPSR